MSSASSLLKPAAKAALTLLAVAAAVILVTALWRAYVLAPWTRDGRVSAQIVGIAPEINGTVIEVPLMDDQYVERGDVLYRIDPERFEREVQGIAGDLPEIGMTPLRCAQLGWL